MRRLRRSVPVLPSGRLLCEVLGRFVRPGQVLFWTFTGTVECLDANTRKSTGFLAFYSNVDRPDLVVPPLGIFGVHDQDKDDDGFADAGEAPFLSLPLK
jgi:hypothetical protein